MSAQRPASGSVLRRSASALLVVREGDAQELRDCFLDLDQPLGSLESRLEPRDLAGLLDDLAVPRVDGLGLRPPLAAPAPPAHRAAVPSAMSRDATSTAPRAAAAHPTRPASCSGRPPSRPAASPPL